MGSDSVSGLPITGKIGVMLYLVYIVISKDGFMSWQYGSSWREPWVSTMEITS